MGEPVIPDPAAREKFFGERAEEVGGRFSEGTEHFDFSEDHHVGDVFRRIVPGGLERIVSAEARRHFVAAEHELLQAVRALLDFWIDETKPGAAPPEPARHVKIHD